VYEVSNPSNHSTIKTTAIVYNIVYALYV
jgi:hypothetical protein